MTDAELAAIRARCEAATPGPWVYEPQDSSVWEGLKTCRQIAHCQSVAGAGMIRDKEQLRANSIFIAAAREDVPALLDEVERLRAEVARLKAEIEWLRGLLGRAVQESCDHVLGRYGAQTDAKDGGTNCGIEMAGLCNAQGGNNESAY